MKKIIENFQTSGGKHCITNSLKQIFEYYNCPISEEMLFGLGAGLSFCYVNLETSPMINGRIKVFEFERILARRLQIDITCKSSAKYDVAYKKTIALINEDKPVLIYVDMPYLEYLHLDQDNHFGGHAVVLFGYDDEKREFYISDRDNSDYPIRTPIGNIAEDYHIVDYSEVEKARSSTFRPFPSKNKYLDIQIKDRPVITKAMIYEAIMETCENMLHAPAKLLGLNGILKFSKEIIKWNRFDDEKLYLAGVKNYFMISADGGTGGGIFRNMYGGFLIEASNIVENDELARLGQRYIAISKQWDHVANLMWELSETLDRSILKQLSSIARELYEEEKTVLEELREVVIQ